MTAATKESAAAKKTSRDASLDSLAGVLIVLVVFGHAVGMVAGQYAESAYLFAFLFHMPAFVWLSGLMTQYSRKWSVGQLVARLLFPFLVFSLIQSVFVMAWTGDDIDLGFPNLGWTMWYLLALFIWRLFAPLLLKTRWTIPVSFLMALGVGAVPFIGYGYSLGRIIGFLPFFLLGLFWRREWLATLSRYWWAGLLAFGLAAVIAWNLQDRTRIGSWLMAVSYEKLDQGTFEGLSERFGILALAVVLVIALIAVAYRPLPIFASIGMATLPVYLLHSLFLMPWRLDGMDIGVTGVWAVVALAFGSLAFAWLASRPIVGRAIEPLSDFTWWSKRFGIGTPHERELDFSK